MLFHLARSMVIVCRGQRRQFGDGSARCAWQGCTDSGDFVIFRVEVRVLLDETHDAGSTRFSVFQQLFLPVSVLCLN